MPCPKFLWRNVLDMTSCPRRSNSIHLWDLHQTATFARLFTISRISLTCIKGMATQVLTLSIVEPYHSSETASSNQPIPTARLRDPPWAQGVCILESPTPGEEYSAWVRQWVPALRPKGERKDCEEINASLPLQKMFFWAKRSRPLVVG